MLGSHSPFFPRYLPSTIFYPFSKLRSRDLQELKFDEECTAFITVQYDGETSNQSLVCETPSGMMYEIPEADDSFITENFEKGPFVSGETVITFSGRPLLNKSANTISSSIQDLVLTKKKNLRKGGPFGAATTGDRTVLIVRVIALDASITADEAALSDDVFGTHGDPVNLKTQFSKCSQGQLNFIPAVRTGITDGATTVSINVVSKDQGKTNMKNYVSDALKTKFGASNPGDLADHVMFCYPNEAMNYLIDGLINSWFSAFNDQYCGPVSFQMYAVGLNLGLSFSNVDLSGSVSVF